jgi:hypothetical protein
MLFRATRSVSRAASLVTTIVGITGLAMHHDERGMIENRNC